MADAHRRRFDAVVVWKFDRFARSVSHLLRALETFRALGIEFVSFSEQLDTSTPAGKLVFTVLGAVAEMERSLIVGCVEVVLTCLCRDSNWRYSANKSGRKAGGDMLRFWSRLPALVPIMISILLASLECRAQSPTPETLSPPILPANTPVILRLKQSLYKRDAKPGQPVEFAVGFDVVVNGQIYIQSGVPVTGSLRQVDKTGKGPTKVLIDLGPTQTITGERVRLAGPGTTTASDQPHGVADAVSWGAELPPIIPVLVVMSLFEKKVLLDKDAGRSWLGWCPECGVWVVAHVAENVALDPEKLTAAQAQHTTELKAAEKAAEIESCRFLQSRNPESSPDENALFGALLTFTARFKAQLLRQAGDLDAAIDELDAAIDEYQQALALTLVDCPGLRDSEWTFATAPLHVSLAELFREKHEFGHAIAEYRAAVQLNPKDEHTREGFVTFLLESDDPDATLAETKEAMALWPDNIYFHYLMGEVLVKKSDPDGAIVELQWVLKQEKNHDWKASCALGRAYELKGDLKAALGQYHTAYRVRMDDEQCRSAYERLRLQLKK